MNGLGGVEVHARALHQNLLDLGVESVLTTDLNDLFSQDWDVIHTHGTSRLPWWVRWKLRNKSRFVHTLHGTAFGRMWACGEYFWVRGYWAAWIEIEAALLSDFVFSVHDGLWLFRWMRLLKGTKAQVCSNGWDPSLSPQPLPPDFATTLQALPPFWLYIGRGHDIVKNTRLLERALRPLQSEVLIAVPGEGFECDGKRIIASGRLTSSQVQELLNQGPERIKGLVLCSLYEGYPLVVLEALALGLPVLVSNVGGMRHLPSGLRGIHRMNSFETGMWTRALRESESWRKEAGPSAGKNNQSLLRTWKQVAQTYLAAVKR